MKEFYSHGKLLITGEYLVLDGAKALAVPTVFGQSLSADKINNPYIIWKSYDAQGNLWQEVDFRIDEDGWLIPEKTNAFAQRLLQILNSISIIRPGFFSKRRGFEVETHLEFDTEWGLGSSSTLISNLAKWTETDPYELLDRTFGGSGYDIACALNDSPILYSIANTERTVQQVSFSPPFSEHIYFIHLNRKQDSREAIAQYRKSDMETASHIKRINEITENMLKCEDIDQFCSNILDHENLISGLIGIETVKDRLFPDFDGCIKSLGGWGGDFIMVVSKSDPADYFRSKGFNTIIPYAEMVLK